MTREKAPTSSPVFNLQEKNPTVYPLTCPVPICYAVDNRKYGEPQKTRMCCGAPVSQRFRLAEEGGEIMEHHTENYTVAMGGKIYSLRVAKGMTQEQLAGVLCISPAAISKWERNLANPNIGMLWALADFFECSIDELVGRKTKELERAGEYDRARLRMAQTAAELLALAEVSRQQGLLAMEKEVANYKGESSFLPFAVHFFMESMMAQLMPERIAGLLKNYAGTLAPSEQAEGVMIAEVLSMIVAGEEKALIQEVAASHIGMGYSDKIRDMGEALRMVPDRFALIEKYRGKALFSERTGLLEELVKFGDFEIQVLLRNLDNATLTAALCGASGAVVERFLVNLAYRVLVFVCEDIERFGGTEEEIIAAQERVLELSCRVCGKEGEER